MRVWLYARLSNDDDPAQNSLQNQQEICRAFAEKKGWTIIGSSADDNISGNFINKIHKMGNCSENFVGRWRRKDPTCVFIYFVKQDGEKQAICINFPQFVKYCEFNSPRRRLFPEWSI